MNNTILKIIMSLVGMISCIFIFNIYDTFQIIFIFIAYFVIISVVFWFISWFMSSFISSRRITKESDEILHPVTQIENTLHITNIQKHYEKNYNVNLVEKCCCGSTIFRIYNEDTDKGTYIQFICVKCNTKATGLEFNWKEQEKNGGK